MILQNESYRKGIINSSIFNVIGKSAAFVQQWLIGYYFGVDSGTDMFFFSYNIILFVSFFFLNFTTSVLIPEGMKIRNTEGDETSKKFFNSYIMAYAAIGLVLLLLCNISPTRLLGLISSFPTETIENNITLIRWCIPIIFLNMVVSIISEILVSYKYFTIPNVITLVNYTIGIIFIVAFHDYLSINSIAIGLILGYIANLIIVGQILRKKLNWNFMAYGNSRFRQIAGSAIYSQISHVVYLAALYVPQNIFTSLPAGYLTAINFADKILTIPSIFLVGQITNVMAVKINNLVSFGDMRELSRLAEKLLIVITTMLLLAALLISFLSDWIVKVLFSLWNYDPELMSVTSRMLSTLILYLPFSYAFSILTKFFNAFKKQNKFFYLQTCLQLLTISLYIYCIPQYGIYVYPSCRIVTYIIAILCAIPLIKSFFREMRTRYTIIALLLISSITIAILAYDLIYAHV